MAGVGQDWILDPSGDAMFTPFRHGLFFTLFRYVLIPIVLFCGTIVAASIDVFSTTAIRKSTWPQTVATVLQSEDRGHTVRPELLTPNTRPDPYGTVSYAVDGKTYTWEGRGIELGVAVMRAGDQIKVYYNPGNPREINTLVLLGATTASILLACALAFLTFYVWFFWIRVIRRRSGPHDFDGDVPGSLAGGVPDRLSSPAASRGVTFGRR